MYFSLLITDIAVLIHETCATLESATQKADEQLGEFIVVYWYIISSLPVGKVCCCSLLLTAKLRGISSRWECS